MCGRRSGAARSRASPTRPSPGTTRSGASTTRRSGRACTRSSRARPCTPCMHARGHPSRVRRVHACTLATAPGEQVPSSSQLWFAEQFALGAGPCLESAVALEAAAPASHAIARKGGRRARLRRLWVQGRPRGHRYLVVTAHSAAHAVDHAAAHSEPHLPRLNKQSSSSTSFFAGASGHLAEGSVADLLGSPRMPNVSKLPPVI